MAKKASYISSLPTPEHVVKRNPNYRGPTNCDWMLDNVVNIPITDKITPAQTDRVVKSLVTCLRNYKQYVKELDS